MSTQPRIFITDQDHHRLMALLSQVEGPWAEALEEELGRAHVIAQTEIPRNVVTMNSRVQFLDEATGQESQMTLVYPQDAKLEEGRISILAPVGMALLGLTEGQSIDWKMPNGSVKKLSVRSVEFQPEAEGRWDL
ncbi:transcription elongation factor GreAB [Bdellovibrio bacteriovorus]|uniref:Transcription elongation factor GreAB n=1 Tax=Bdellovibrio bacteriovorus TaxID=959 RepID=A0A150WCD5_BDEBC|nr:nucleoside diphosphate kinase regulator [Bdellovibrio bacteriovorus]KYG60591.1 transcription elongation factor GreAB [Bdellovibrio bacteriovorus]